MHLKLSRAITVTENYETLIYIDLNFNQLQQQSFYTLN